MTGRRRGRASTRRASRSDRPVRRRSPSRWRGWLYGWRGALIAISCVALVSLLAWVVLTWGEAHAAPAATVPRLPWHSGTAWLLVAIFGLMASAYYGLNAWLPDAYAERGWSDRSAGLLLAMMNLTAIPALFVYPLLDRTGRRSPFLLGLSLCFITGTVALVALPGVAYTAGALLAGVAQGGLFALVMTLPLDFERTPDAGRGARRDDAGPRLHDRGHRAVPPRRGSDASRVVQRRPLARCGVPDGAVLRRCSRSPDGIPRRLDAGL